MTTISKKKLPTLVPAKPGDGSSSGPVAL